MTMKKIIPLHVVRNECTVDIDELDASLQRAGYLRMTQMAGPRLAELVEKYMAKGYEVEIAPVLDEAEPLASSGGCASRSSCSSAGSSSSCSSGGCGSDAAQPAAAVAPAQLSRREPRKVIEGAGTIYVRLPN